MSLAKHDDVRASLSFMIFATVAACAPFGADIPDVQESGDTAAEPPSKKKASTAPSSSSSESPTTSTVPTMPASVCSGALFCDDFEAGELGNGLWEDFKEISGDTLRRTAPSASTGAFSLGFIVSPGGEEFHSALRRDLGSFGHVELSFAVQIPPTFGDDGGHANLAHLDFGGEDLVLTIVGDGKTIGLVASDDHRDYALVRKVPLSSGPWHAVKLIVDLVGESPTSKMTIDGVDVVTADPLALHFGGPPSVRLTLGPDYSTTAAPYEVRFDDVRIDAVK